MRDRIAIVDGIRTPMAKAGTALKDFEADDLGAIIVRELIQRVQISYDQIDELIFGNVATPVHAANIARIIALKAGLPADLPSYTVSRNCASGMESISSAASKIMAGEGKVYIAGGTESMSNIPFLFSREMKDFYSGIHRAHGIVRKIRTLFSFRFHYLKPEIGVMKGLTDPISGPIMGETAEILAREFDISREMQDIFALQSHQKAVRAIQEGILAREIVSVPLDSGSIMEKDNGPRENQTLGALSKLKPYFDREQGTVTVGNASPLTDGACALLVMEEKTAREQGYVPLGYVREYAYAALDPEHMGLGPVHASAALLSKSGASMKDFEIIELNEAFAAQVLACEKAFISKEYANKFLGLGHSLGELNMDVLNVNGGAIALGHPVGMSGARLVLHALMEMKRTDRQTGLAALCVGGGQGAAFFLEAE